MNLSVSIRLGLGLSVRVWAPFAAGEIMAMEGHTDR